MTGPIIVGGKGVVREKIPLSLQFGGPPCLKKKKKQIPGNVSRYPISEPFSFVSTETIFVTGPIIVGGKGAVRA